MSFTDGVGGGAAADALRGRRVHLRPFLPSDFDFTYSLHLEPNNLVSYRLRGSIPSPESFHRFFWDQALLNLVAVGDSGEPIGVLTAYAADHRNGTCYIAVVGSSDAQVNGLMVEATGLLISYLFLAFPFRKIYMESLRENYAKFSSGEGRLFNVEAQLLEHEYVDGRYADMVTVAVYRRDWPELSRFVYGRQLDLGQLDPAVAQIAR